MLVQFRSRSFDHSHACLIPHWLPHSRSRHGILRWMFCRIGDRDRMALGGIDRAVAVWQSRRHALVFEFSGPSFAPFWTGHGQVYSLACLPAYSALVSPRVYLRLLVCSFVQFVLMPVHMLVHSFAHSRFCSIADLVMPCPSQYKCTSVHGLTRLWRNRFMANATQWQRGKNVSWSIWRWLSLTLLDMLDNFARYLFSPFLIANVFSLGSCMILSHLCV